MELPAHYRAFYAFFIRFALVMLVVGGITGVAFQELTGAVTFRELAPGAHLEAFYRLALVHGHSFLVGAIMPIVWITILHLTLKLGGRPVSAKALRWIIVTYVPGTVSTIGLLLYKGLHYATEVRRGERDFDLIHRSIFGGSRMVRGIVYASAHSIASAALVIFAVVVWKSLRSIDGDRARE